MFGQRITDKATSATAPVKTIAINPAYTSMRCHECGYTDKKNRKSQALFCCLSCGYTHNADVNAAKNIIAAGLAVTGRGGTSHAESTKTQHPDPVKRTTTPKAA
jgi:transposase